MLDLDALTNALTQAGWSHVSMGVYISGRNLVSYDTALALYTRQTDAPAVSIGDYDSLKAIRSQTQTTVISLSAIWTGDPRQMLSWHAAAVQDDRLIEFAFLPIGGRELSLELLLGVVCDYLGISAVDGRKLSDETPYSRVTLLTHAGKGTLSSLDQSGKNQYDLLGACREVQGGVVTVSQPIRLRIKSTAAEHGRNTWHHCISLDMRDTMTHTPDDMDDLNSMAGAVNWPAVQRPSDDILQENPVALCQYGAWAATVPLLYAGALYKYNHKIPVTITSATAHVMRACMAAELGTETAEDFDYRYRGLVRSGQGLAVRQDGGYSKASALFPASDTIRTIHAMAAQAYHGGYNNCSDLGFFPGMTYDMDLAAAYATVMSLLPDVDWSNPVQEEIRGRELTLDDLQGPLSLIVAYVRFQFPAGTMYPCLPVYEDKSLMFPLSSDGLAGVYAAGPELYLALKMGATVYCETGYVLRPLVIDGRVSRSLRAATAQLVKDRQAAKAEYGEGSLTEQVLKAMVNSGSGKLAQGVADKGYLEEGQTAETKGLSPISNHVSVCLLASVVRATLLATQAQAHEKDYKVVSVTTDGCITDMPMDVLKNLDLYGFRAVLEDARLFLTDGESNEAWTCKHKQTDLINFTTRGNISLSPEGVCAHAGAKSGYVPDSPEDRLWMYTAVLARTGPVPCVQHVETPYSDLQKSKPYTVKETVSKIRLDYDCKRKPDKDSFIRQEVTINGSTYEIASFSTVPYENVEEYRLYRKAREACTVLRTMDDWDRFWTKVQTSGTKAKVRDLDWSILLSCVMGHHAGLWCIPALETGSVKDKVEFLNRHNRSNKKFSADSWKNSRRPDRWESILPDNLIGDLLAELINSTDYNTL